MSSYEEGKENLCNPKVRINVGDTVILGFRSQMFTSRSKVAVISGIKYWNTNVARSL